MHKRRQPKQQKSNEVDPILVLDEGEDDNNDVVCFLVCGNVGELLCCEGCKHAVHDYCVELRKMKQFQTNGIASIVQIQNPEQVDCPLKRSPPSRHQA